MLFIVSVDAWKQEDRALYVVRALDERAACAAVAAQGRLIADISAVAVDEDALAQGVPVYVDRS